MAAIESAYAGRLAEHRDHLAHHVVRGEVWGKALAYLRPGPGLDDLLGGEAVSGVAAGSPHWMAGRHAQAVERAQADSQATTLYMNFNGQLMVHLQLGQAYHSMGAYRRAIEILARNARMLDGDLRLHRIERWPALPAVLSLAWLALSHAQVGQTSGAEACAREAVAVADAAEDAYSLATAGWALGTVALLKGDAAAAEPALARARRAAEGLPGLPSLIGAPLGLALALQGRPAAGAGLVAESVRDAEAQGLRADHAMRVIWQAEVERLADRFDGAAALAQRGVELARAHGERGHQAHGLHLLAVLAARGSPAPRRAEEHYREALGLAEELEMRPLATRCRAALGAIRARAEPK